MIIYRLVKFEGSPDAVAAQMARSIDGVWRPSQVTITACHIKGGAESIGAAAIKQLEEAAGREWVPPRERLTDPVTVFVPGTFRTAKPALHGRIEGFPGARRPSNSPTSQEAAAFIRRIDDMLEEESSRGGLRYEWAADTLTGIRDTVEQKGFVTDAQRTAVDNIENARRSS